MADDLVTRLRVMQDRLGAPNELCREAAATIAAQSARIDALESAIRWALGYDEGEPQFGEQSEQRGAFAWRAELRRRAGQPWLNYDNATRTIVAAPADAQTDREGL